MLTVATKREYECSSGELLHFLEKSGIIDTEDLLNNLVKMKNKEIIEQHPYNISQGTDGRWRTYLPDATKPNGRRQIAKATETAIHKAIIDDYEVAGDKNNLANTHLENLYEKWMLWRRDTGTDPKTIKENRNDWNKYLKNSVLAKKRVKDISLVDLEDFFLSITGGHAITFKCLCNVRSELSGIFKFAVRQGLVQHSIVLDVDYRQYRTRCKPSKSDKAPYTDDERKKVLAYLADKTDVYSLCIELAFYLCLRIGELQVIEKADVGSTELTIGRSMRRQQIMNDDLSFGPIQYTVEERIKGNQTAGFRTIPLTPHAQAIVEKTLALYPEGEYLFMRWGKPLLANTFNKHLRRVCKALDIPYRPSHQIRFSTATKLHEAGVPLNQLSALLGHSETRTTFQYIKQKGLDKQSTATMIAALDV